MAYYPIFVEMKDRPCLVIGGGRVAEGKVQGLLAAEAAVTVVAPDLTPALQSLHDDGRFAWREGLYETSHLDGFDTCFVATDDGAVNATVAADCRARGLWINAADDPVNCDFILPSVIRQGQVVVAASTGGASPALARRLREDLTAFLSDDFAPLAELLNTVRSELKSRNLSVDAERWQTAIDGRLRALVAQRRPEEAREHLLARLGVNDAMAESR